MFGKWSLIALIIGYCLDLCIGDPYFLWHPIRAIGNGITKVEKVLRNNCKKKEDKEKALKKAGIYLVVIMIAACVGISGLILWFAYQIYPMVGLVIESIMCYQILATKSLKDESMKVYKCLLKKDKEGARHAVSMIVGRDTKCLTEEGIIKAAIETVAENTSDGIIAPLLFMAIGGAPLGFLYKTINTMDSMVGYKNDAYLYFGRAAAKLDDVVNYIPARVSALLMIVGTLLNGMDTKAAIRIYKRDRYNHASPNSAHTESVAAGAMGLALAGDAYYFGKLYHKKKIGDAKKPAEKEDIKKINQLLYISSFLGILLFAGTKFLILKIF